MKTSHPFTTIVILSPMILLLGFGLDLYLPSEPIVMRELNLNVAQVQLTLTIFMYCFGLGQLIIGPFVDCLGKKVPLRVSLVCFILGCILMYLNTNYYILLIARSCQAFGACGAMVVSLAFIRQKFSGSEVTQMITYLKGISCLAPIIAPSLGVYLALNWGWRSDFLFLAILGGFALLLSYFLQYPVVNDKAEIKHAFKGYFAILKNHKFMIYALSAACVQMTMFGFFSISPLIYIEILKLSEIKFAVLFSINALAFIIIAFGAGRYIAKVGVDRSLQISASLFLLGGILLFILRNILGLTVLSMVIPCFISSAGAAFGLGSSNTGALIPFKQNAGKAAALLGCIEFILGGYLGAWVVYGHINTIYPLSICFVAAGIVIFIIQYLKLKFKIS